MLKLGWKEGEGLGTEGQGITQPVNKWVTSEARDGWETGSGCSVSGKVRDTMFLKKWVTAALFAGRNGWHLVCKGHVVKGLLRTSVGKEARKWKGFHNYSGNLNGIRALSETGSVLKETWTRGCKLAEKSRRHCNISICSFCMVGLSI